MSFQSELVGAHFSLQSEFGEFAVHFMLLVPCSRKSGEAAAHVFASVGVKIA